MFVAEPVTVGVSTEALLRFAAGVQATEAAPGLQVALITAFCLHNKLRLEPAVAEAGK